MEGVVHLYLLSLSPLIVQTHSGTCVHSTHTGTLIDAYTQTCMCAHMVTQRYMYTHVRTCIHTCVHTNSGTCTHMRAHTHVHMHTMLCAQYGGGMEA